MMPGMNGYQVLEHLRSDPHSRDVPVIFVTARIDPDSETQGIGPVRSTSSTNPSTRRWCAHGCRRTWSGAQQRVALLELNRQLEQSLAETRPCSASCWCCPPPSNNRR